MHPSLWLLVAALGPLAASAHDLAVEDLGCAPGNAFEAFKALRPTAARSLTATELTREGTKANVSITYLDRGRERSVAYVCEKKTIRKRTALECAAETKIEAEAKGDAPTAIADGSWDSRRREYSAEDCGASAAAATAALKKWRAEAAAGLRRYTLERNKYSATVVFAYRLGDEARDRTKTYVCHWHGKEIDCH